MNFLLIFAFIATIFSLIRDFVDSGWEWRDKFIFTVILVLFSFAPLACNFVIFVLSDRFCLKEIWFQLLKAVTMDAFEELTGLLLSMEKGIYCNLSSYSASVHTGGEQYYMSEGSPCLDEETISSTVDLKLKNIHFIETGHGPPVEKDHSRLLEIIREIFKGKEVEIKTEDTSQGYNKYTFTRQSQKLIVFGNEFFRLGCQSGEIVFKKDGCETVLKTGLSMNSFFFRVMKGKISYLICFKIGVLDLRVDQNYVYFYRKNKVVNKIDVSGLFSSTDSCKYLHLLCALSFWERNPEKGVIDKDSYDRHDERDRRGTKIIHSYNVTEIVSLLLGSNTVSLGVLPPNKYRVEGDKSDCLYYHTLKESLIKVVGEVNFNTISKIIGLYIKDTESGGACKILNMILNLNTSMGFREVLAFEFKISRRSVDKMMTELDYFLRMIGYGRVSGSKRDIRISKQAVIIAMDHSKLPDVIIKPASRPVKSENELLSREMRGRLLEKKKKSKDPDGNPIAPQSKAEKKASWKLAKKSSEKSKKETILKLEAEVASFKNRHYEGVKKTYLSVLEDWSKVEILNKEKDKSLLVKKFLSSVVMTPLVKYIGERNQAVCPWWEKGESPVWDGDCVERTVVKYVNGGILKKTFECSEERFCRKTRKMEKKKKEKGGGKREERNVSRENNVLTSGINSKLKKIEDLSERNLRGNLNFYSPLLSVKEEEIEGLGECKSEIWEAVNRYKAELGKRMGKKKDKEKVSEIRKSVGVVREDVNVVSAVKVESYGEEGEREGVFIGKSKEKSEEGLLQPEGEIKHQGTALKDEDKEKQDVPEMGSTSDNKGGKTALQGLKMEIESEDQKEHEKKIRKEIKKKLKEDKAEQKKKRLEAAKERELMKIEKDKEKAEKLKERVQGIIDSIKNRG